jgi:hypothetical protein
MSTAMSGIYQQPYAKTDEELLFITSFLEKNIHRPIIITNHNGFIHYPKLNTLFSEHNLITIPRRAKESKYFYHEADGVLYYPVVYKVPIAFIIIKNLPSPELAKALEILAEAKLAISYYFANNQKTEQNTLHLQNQIIEHLFFADKKDIQDIIRLYSNSINQESQYFAVVLDTGSHIDAERKQKICAYSQEYMKIKKLDSIQLSYSNYLIQIIADRFSPADCPKDFDYTLLLQHKKTLENHFNQCFSQGIGTSYPFADIKKSFHEAMLALNLSNLMGQKGNSQRFSDLGIFTQILNQDSDKLTGYCIKALSPILDYDKANNTCLLITLRMLLDHNLNYKETAQSLYIHTNTLYYRKNKMEELLGLDLTQMCNIVNLYIAIKILDLGKHL